MHRYLLLATCIVFLACVAIVSAESYTQFNNIDEDIVFKDIAKGHTIFFGEELLNVTDCMGGHKYVVAMDSSHNVTDHIYIPDPTNFTFPTDKDENMWYQADGPNLPVSNGTNYTLAFTSQEPVLEFNIWNLNTDMKAESSEQRGTLLQFKFTTSTNLEDITTRHDWLRQKILYLAGMAPYESLGYVNIGLINPDNYQLFNLTTMGRVNGNIKQEWTKKLVLGALPGESTVIDPSPAWVWPKNMNSQTANPTGWMTGWRNANQGQETDYYYGLGNYSVTAICNVNNMFKNRQVERRTWETQNVQLIPRTVSVSLSGINGTKSRDSFFTATVSGMKNTSYQIFIYDECPPKLTGKACDRPPYINGTRSDLAQKGINLDPVNGPYVIGNQPVIDCCKENMTIRQAVPSGDTYPSKGDWSIVDKGTRYYAEVITGADGTVTVPFYIDTTVKPGKFTVQAQDVLYDIKATTTLSVPLGTITGKVMDASGKSAATYYLGDELWIEGTNSDSNMTYIWLTGPGLEPCGVNLFDPTGSTNPVEAVVYDTKNGQANYWRVDPNWRTGKVPIGPGNYTLWMSSVDPTCINCQCNTSGASTTCGFGSCFGVDCENGVCALQKCPGCASFTSIPITLIKPDLTANINDTTRCCCPGYPCGKLGGVSEMWLTGSSGGNSCKQLQVWLFGQSQFGLKNYLMAVTPIYCDGTYKFELNKGLLQANGIDLCSLATGRYDVIVQAPGTNNKFDIRLGDQEKTGDRYVLTTMPTNDSKLFKIEGKDALYAGQAVRALIDGLNQPAIDDLYAHATFELKDKACEGNVDFSADKTEGNAPLAVQFTDKSVMQGVSWQWFSNGFPFSTEQNPKHTFNETGKYTIRLNVTDAEGITNFAVKDSYINVISSPMADFSYAPKLGRIGEKIQFTDTSTGSPGSWMWDFGDGNTSSLQSPDHVYSAAGVYSVTLKVSNAMGVGTEKTLPVTIVNNKPVAAFSADPTTSDYYPVQVEFTDESTGVIDTWSWKFIREGAVVASSSEQNPVITFTVPGIYTVNLTVKNDGGSDTASKENYIIIGTGSQFTVSPGWNHVSVPKAVTDNYNTVSKLFAPVNSGGIPYAVYSNEDAVWVNVSNDYPVQPLEALRVWKADSGTITITPKYIDGQSFSRNLSVGWNGIGIMYMQPTAANVALASLGTTWNKTLSFNPTTQRWEYPIIRGVDDNQTMEPTVGYVIEMNTEGILTGGE